jgi:hypothetical protein
MKGVSAYLIMSLFFVFSLSTFTGCREDKSTKEKIEDSAEEVGEEVEEVGEEVEEVAEEVEDEVDDATDDN